MIYRGFNEIELKRIKDILDRNNVEFTVSVPQDAVEYIEDKSKRVNHKFMDSLLQIEIQNEEFEKISKPDLAKLFDLRIYPEEESPFTEEDFATMITDPQKPVAPKPDSNAKSNQLAAILAVTTVTIFFLWKNGFFR